MRVTILTALAIAVAVVGACAQGEPESGETEATLESLRQQERAFLRALSARDLDGTTGHFAEDAVLHVANMPPVRGRSAIRDFYGNVFRFMAASDPTPETVRVAEAGDMGYTTGRVTNSFRSEAGPIEFTGKYLLVWERREGDWAVVVYSVSNNAGEGGS